MSENENNGLWEVPTEPPLPAYQPPTLRIAATYSAPDSGLPAGHPDNVEIELNLPSLDDAEDLHLSEFVTAIVSSLFRYGTEPPSIGVDRSKPWSPNTLLPNIPNVSTTSGLANPGSFVHVNGKEVDR